MPELPEAEILRRYLEKYSLKQEIKSVEVIHPKVLHEIAAKDLEKRLVGRQFLLTSRHGKFIFMKLQPRLWITVHLGMTGWLSYLPSKKDKSPHERIIITFRNENRLVYSDPRMFGRVGLAQSPHSFASEKDLGPDALSLDFLSFSRLLQKRRGTIKSALLDQHLMAGLGNIYSDEVLFQAGVCPDIRVDRLEKKKQKDLFQCMQNVLETAISCELDKKELPAWYLLPNRNFKGRCPFDGAPLRHAKIGGRTSYFCPIHQKK